LLDGGDIYISAGEKFFQGYPFLRGLRVEGKGEPLNLDSVRFSQPFSTYSTEITPWSGIVREYFEEYRQRHIASFPALLFLNITGSLSLWYSIAPFLNPVNSSGMR
jgi:hypothetical protein